MSAASLSRPASPDRRAARPARGPVSVNLFIALIRRLTTAFAITRERRRLTGLEPHLLDDIGLTRTDAMRESRRPFWDAPDHWLR